MVNEEKHDKKEQNGYERAIKYMGVFGGTQSFAILLGIIKTKFATKLLGASGLGIIAMYNRTLQMLSDFTNLSLSFSAVRQIAEAHKEGDAVKLQHWVKVLRSWTFLTAVVGVFLAIALYPLLGKWVFEGNDYYTSRFLLLSPVVGFMAIIGGELAILKGVQSLYKVAKYTLWTALAGLLVSVPLYFCMGVAGIFPAMFFTSFLQMAVLLYYSLPIFPYRIAPFSRRVLRDGLDMVKFGIGYIFAAIMGSSSTWLVCKVLIDLGNDTIVGFYSTALTLMSLLPGILHASIDSDYYPRLSSVNKDFVAMNTMVNEQAEVQLLIQTPLLLAYLLALQLLVPLLYDFELMAAVPITQLALFGMFIRTMTYPISYLPLARGDSKIFILQEAIYDVLYVLLVVCGYKFFGLIGVGAAVAIAYFLEWIVVCVISFFKYRFTLSKELTKCFVLQIPLFLLMLFVTQTFKGGVVYWASGTLIAVASAILSFYLLSKRLSLIKHLIGRVKRIIK
jgi:O-antigen/teichoic acid export membrane protein